MSYGNTLYNSSNEQNKLHMRCIASGMFVPSNVNSSCSIQKGIYSLQCRVETSLNPILQNLVISDLHCLSSTHRQWMKLLYSF